MARPQHDPDFNGIAYLSIVHPVLLADDYFGARERHLALCLSREEWRQAEERLCRSFEKPEFQILEGNVSSAWRVIGLENDGFNIGDRHCQWICTHQSKDAGINGPVDTLSNASDILVIKIVTNSA